MVPGVVLMICFLGFVGYCLLLTFDNDKAYEHGEKLLLKKATQKYMPIVFNIPDYSAEKMLRIGRESFENKQ